MLTTPARRCGHRRTTARLRELTALLLAVLAVACTPDGEPPSDPPQPPSTGAPGDVDGSGSGPPDPSERTVQPAEPPEAEAPATPDDEQAAADGGGPTPAVAPPDLTVATRLREVARLGLPTAGAVGPDGTLYVADRSGMVHPVTPDGAQEPVIDIRDETSTGSERGLLGIAFHPEFDELYLSYTDQVGDTVIEAFGITAGQIDPDDRRTVFTAQQPFGNHNGGQVIVGPDGLLYIGLGDGGGAGDPHGNGQDLTTPLGALLRIDPDSSDPYGIPPGNPFTDVEGARPEIYAYGLRNPWRFSFDRETGDLWIADVGQNSREEINVVPADAGAGANFGWSLMEGDQSFAGSEPDDHVPPIHTYDTSSSRCAVTGGHVYRGAAIPELRGAYLFSDFCEGLLRALVLDANGEVAQEADLGVDGGSVVSFVEDAAGELYVLDLDGPILRLEPA